jgi:hypothetical protein
MKEEVSEEEGKKYAQEIGVDFELITARDGHGVDKLFKKLVLKFLEQKKENNSKNDDKNKKGIVINKANSKSKKKSKCCG